MNFSEEYLEDYYDMFIQTDQSEQVKQSIRVVSMVIYSITCVLGIPGNAFVIWIAGVKMKRTVNIVWFVNLAVADLLCCFSIPFSLAEIILNQHWPFGEAMCKVIPSVMYLNMFSSVFTLVLISLDRFVLIILPVWAQNHRSINLAWLLCGLAWVLALLLSLPTMIHNGTIDRDDNGKMIRCISIYPLGENEIRGIFLAIKATHVPRLVLGFLIPLLVISVCYLLICRRVSSRRLKSQRTFWIILAVVAAFFVCWLPYHIIGMVIGYGRFVSAGEALNWYPVVISLAYVNSCLNPILYVFVGQDFKERVRVSFQKVFENVFSEDATTHTSVSQVCVRNV